MGSIGGPGTQASFKSEEVERHVLVADVEYQQRLQVGIFGCEAVSSISGTISRSHPVCARQRSGIFIIARVVGTRPASRAIFMSSTRIGGLFVVLVGGG
jgi:hypothetical protein